MKHTAILTLVTMVSAMSGCDFSYEDEVVKNRSEILSKEFSRVNVTGGFSYGDDSTGVSGAGGAVGSNTFLAGFETSWIAGDRIGLFSPQALTAPGAAPGSQNLPFTANTSAQSSQFSGEMYWGSGLHDFYAYYPYNSDALSSPAAGQILTSESATVSENSSSEISVKISLPANQIQNGDNSDHVGNYDFMVATPLKNISGEPISGSSVYSVSSGTSGSSISESTGTNASPQLNFRFHHLFSLLVFQFKSSFITGEIVSLKLTSHEAPISLNSGTVDISQPSPAAGVSYTINAGSSPSDVSITLTEISDNCRITSLFTKSAKLYLVILPGDYSSQNFTLELTVKESDGTTQSCRMIKKGTEIRRGTLYTVPLNLNDFTW